MTIDTGIDPSIPPSGAGCVECGYCEPVCPSKDLTTTPRQRIVLRREIVRAREAGDEALAARHHPRIGRVLREQREHLFDRRRRDIAESRRLHLRSVSLRQTLLRTALRRSPAAAAP